MRLPSIVNHGFLKLEAFYSSKEVKTTLQEFISEEKTPLENATALSTYVFNNFSYQKGITNIATKTDEVWKLQRRTTVKLFKIVCSTYEQNDAKSE